MFLDGRNSPAQERSSARSEIYFGSIFLTTASRVARNTNGGQCGRTGVMFTPTIFGADGTKCANQCFQTICLFLNQFLQSLSFNRNKFKLSLINHN